MSSYQKRPKQKKPQTKDKQTKNVQNYVYFYMGEIFSFWSPAAKKISYIHMVCYNLGGISFGTEVTYYKLY